eukprot:TRINITY_DN2861_c0_g4_i1.p1 TRINITY_DN2861_c0_g4~~TRINITY_DN2861_c0_g4_i1.p1  ORF type:complete len:916 (+),score=263.09 TRINITY_DN2861_c0_g4_i1:543-3290(+)
MQQQQQQQDRAVAVMEAGMRGLEPPKPLNILYADDEPANHFVLKTVLHGTAHSLTCVDNGLQALEAAQTGQFHLIFLDVEMPVMGGVQAMNEIRAWEFRTGTRRTSVAFITAHASRRFAQLDIDNVIQKPISRPWILEAISLAQEALCSNQATAAHDVELPFTAEDPFTMHSTPTTTTTTTTGASSSDGLSIDTSFSDAAASHTPPSGAINFVPTTSGWRLLFSRMLLHVDAPEHIRNDADLLWKYRVCVTLCVPLSLAPLLALTDWFDSTYSRVVYIVGCLSYLLYPALMRLPDAFALRLYTLLHQMVATALSILSPYGFYALSLELVFPPAVVLFTGGSTKDSVFCSVVVIAEALLLSHFIPYPTAEVDPFQQPHFVLSVTVSHLFLTAMLTFYLVYADHTRKRSYKKLSVVVKRIARAQRKTQQKRVAAEQFVNCVSYDFRLPLGVVQGMAEVLADESHPPKLQKQIRVLYSACQLLLNMMHNILDAATMEKQTTLQVSESMFNLRDVVAQSARMLQFHAIARDLLIRVLIDRTLPQYLWGDSDRLQQVLVNLLGSAIKFAGKGSIVMRVDLKKEHETLLPTPAAVDMQFEKYVYDDAWSEAVAKPPPADSSDDSNSEAAFESGGSLLVRFLFVDGAGQHRESLIQSPQQSDDDAIVLRISREVVKQMGGVVSIQPGSLFSFVVPFRNVDEDVGMISDADTATWSRPLTVLLVEDSRPILYIWQWFMQGTPHRVILAQTGEEAIRLFQREHVSMLCIGMYLPDMTCMEVLQAMQQLKSGKLPFTVVLTAHASPEARAQAMNAGANMFESTPVTRTRMMALLRTVASRVTSAVDSGQRTPSSNRSADAMDVSQLLQDVARELPHQMALNKLEARQEDAIVYLAEQDSNALRSPSQFAMRRRVGTPQYGSAFAE